MCVCARARVRVCVCVCNMEIYISNSMLCSINDKPEILFDKHVYFLPNMFCYITMHFQLWVGKVWFIVMLLATM